MRILSTQVLDRPVPFLPPTAAPTSAQPTRRGPRRGLDVVVVNYRTPTDLGQFLASYQTHPCAWPGALTVVNVSPMQADLAVVARWQGTLDINHLSFTDNVGYARACNRGAQLVNGDTLALFNADVVLTADALTHCYEALAANPRWGVLGPRQVNATGRLVSGGVFGSNQAPQMRAWNERDVGQCSDVRSAITVSGSAYFVRRDAWKLLADCRRYREAAPDADGAFLPTPHYYEETFCSYHARSHGLDVIFYGPVCITHLWHRASPIGGEADRLMSTSREIFRRACDAHGIDRD